VTAARTLARAHAALSGEERFGAALAALARDDEDEVRRLIESCPRRVYAQPEVAFMDRLQAWDVFTVGVTWLGYALRSRAACAEALLACAQSASGWAADAAAYAAWKAARGHGSHLDERDIDEVAQQVHERLAGITAAARDAEAAARADVAAFEGALDALAGDLGVEPATLRAALGEPEPGEELPEPDSEDRAAMLEHLRFLLSR
jgi:hypothetical protein